LKPGSIAKRQNKIQIVDTPETFECPTCKRFAPGGTQFNRTLLFLKTNGLRNCNVHRQMGFCCRQIEFAEQRRMKPSLLQPERQTTTTREQIDAGVTPRGG